MSNLQVLPTQTIGTKLVMAFVVVIALWGVGSLNALTTFTVAQKQISEASGDGNSELWETLARGKALVIVLSVAALLVTSALGSFVIRGVTVPLLAAASGLEDDVGALRGSLDPLVGEDVSARLDHIEQKVASLVGMLRDPCKSKCC